MKENKIKKLMLKKINRRFKIFYKEPINIVKNK